MREKAKESLSRLREMVPSKRHVPASRIDEDTWTCVTDRGLGRGFSNYVTVLHWMEQNTKARYARTIDAFWFEDGKDAFVYSLKWKNTDS